MNCSEIINDERQLFRIRTEECGKRAEAILNRLTSPQLSASEYDQLLAEYNSELLRYNKIETELLLVGIPPSKRTMQQEKILRERMRN